MLRCPTKSPDARTPLGLQDGHLADDSANSPVTVIHLLSLNLPQFFVGDSFHEPGFEQRDSDEPVMNILFVLQCLYFRSYVSHGFCLYQRAALLRKEFFVLAQESCPDFGVLAPDSLRSTL